MRARLIAATGLAILSGPALAADPVFSATAELNGGYDSNPYLDDFVDSGSATVGVVLSPRVEWREATSTTSVSGQASRTQYLNSDDHSQLYSVMLARDQRFSNQLSGNLALNFLDATTALLSPIEQDQGDIIASGQRQRTYGADGGLSYALSERSSFSASGDIQRSTYPGASYLGDYTSYGGSFGYSHVLSARTTVGASVGVHWTESAIYPDSRVISPGVNITQALNEHWTFTGGVSAILQRSSAGGSGSTTNLGFNASLCGTYPRTSICINASRDAAPSGYGGQRLRTQIGVTGSYQLSEHDRISGSGSYVRDQSGAFDLATPSLSYANARVDYSHDLTERISVGAAATYLRRDYVGAGGRASSIGGNAFIRARLGRL